MRLQEAGAFINVGQRYGQPCADGPCQDPNRTHTHTNNKKVTTSGLAGHDAPCFSASIYADGSHAVEADHLPELQFPKQSFDKPVQFAIFMYGIMREQPQPQQQPDNPLVPLRDLPTDITFPGLSPQHQVPLEVRRLVSPESWASEFTRAHSDGGILWKCTTFCEHVHPTHEVCNL